MGVLGSERYGDLVLVVLLVDPVEGLLVEEGVHQEEGKVFYDHEQEYLPDVRPNRWKIGFCETSSWLSFQFVYQQI